MKRIYFDNAATTPIDKRVLKVIKPYLTNVYGNPSSTHLEGRMARYGVENARKQCAKALGCNSDEIFFTSGASESNSWAYNMWLLHYDEKVHDSLRVYGYNTNIYAVSYINNETGNDDFIDACVLYGKKNNYFLDLTQSIGHKYINLQYLNNVLANNIIGASLSGHKFGAPKGVGLLYIRKDQQEKMKPLIFGHQENGIRGGTENVPGIVGMGKAIELATLEIDKNNKQIKKIVSYIIDKMDTINYKIHTRNHIINFTFNNLNAQTAVQIFDQYGIAISAGSACNSDSEKPSHILLASAYNEEEALRTIRVSIGKQNTIKEAKRFIKILNKIIKEYDKGE